MQTLTHMRSSRPISLLVRRHYATAFGQGPAPPRLPKDDQELYEKLQRASTGAFSTPNPTVVVNQSPSSSSQSQRPQVNQSPSSSQTSTAQDVDGKISERQLDARVKAKGDGEELHPDVRRGGKPEFEGDRNPVTGEVGGPKREPLRWGGEVDWSYNGRVTDF
ncbi:MAG: hypothetical protein Q9174_003589 [Haloplaca sp. 1 TL-2023]